MTEVPQIIDLHRVVEPYLNGGRLISYGSRYLTKPGENYGSIMLAITANVERTDGKIEELPLVAKLPPLTSDLYWQIFQPERTCITENAVYKYLAPALNDLQLEVGIPANYVWDFFPRYYGSRTSLDSAARIVDRDALLVQENLQTSGYKPGRRHKMYDLAHTKLVLDMLAKYHALPIALRLKKPALYNEHIKPYFERFNVLSGLNDEAKKELDQQIIKSVSDATNNNASILERFKDTLILYDQYMNASETVDSKYTTIAHNDLWINNLMIKYDTNGSPCKLKIVDFQSSQYESLAHDIIFFLLSSVSGSVLEDHYDNLLKIYYNSFLDCLESVGVKTDEYTYRSLLEEIKRVGAIQLPHIICMTRITLADNSTLPEELRNNDMDSLDDSSGINAILKKVSEIIEFSQKYNFI